MRGAVHFLYTCTFTLPFVTLIIVWSIFMLHLFNRVLRSLPMLLLCLDRAIYTFRRLGVIRARRPSSRQKLLHRALAEKPSENLTRLGGASAFFSPRARSTIAHPPNTLTSPNLTTNPFAFPFLSFVPRIESITLGYRATSF